MTRFTAATAEARVALIVDAITAHRRRKSPYLTVEADTPPAGTERPAWVQYRARDSRLNVDCLSDEFDRLVEYLETYPAFTIVSRETPDAADAINVHIEGYGDDERLAELIDGLFKAVYEYEPGYRLWVSEV